MICFYTENQLYASIFNTHQTVFFTSNPADRLILNPGVSLHSYLSVVRKKGKSSVGITARLLSNRLSPLS